MGLSISQQAKDIKAELVGIADTYDTQVDDEALLPTFSNGIMKPFYVLKIGGPVRAAKGRSITTSRDHVNIVFVSVACMAATDDALDWLVDEALDALTGFKPSNSGELILEGGLSFSEGVSTVRPTKYLKMLNWTFRTNLTLNSTN